MLWFSPPIKDLRAFVVITDTEATLLAETMSPEAIKGH